MTLDHTADLNTLKQQLVNETNRKVELWQLLIKYGGELNQTKERVLSAQHFYMQVKTQIKCADEKIKSLKALIRVEQMTG